MSPYSEKICILKAHSKKCLSWGAVLMIVGMMIMLSFTGILSLLPYSLGGILLVTALQLSFRADLLKEKETIWHTDQIIGAK